MRVSAQEGLVVVRSGEGDMYREVALNADMREALKMWLKERTKRFPKLLEHAHFLNLKGMRLSTRAIDLVVLQRGADANLELFCTHFIANPCAMLSLDFFRESDEIFRGDAGRSTTESPFPTKTSQKTFSEEAMELGTFSKETVDFSEKESR